MFNRNNIFNTVDETTKAINLNNGKEMYNIYSELNNYKDLYQSRYDKITDALETIKQHVNKVNSLMKNNKDAMYGGSSNQNLMDQINTCLESCETLDNFNDKSNINTKLKDKIKNILALLNVKDDEQKIKINHLQKITAKHFDLFERENKELNDLKKELNNDKKELESLLKDIKDIQKPITAFILKQGLSTYTESIRKGIKEYENVKDIKYKTIEKDFNDYSFSIQDGLSKAKKAQKDDEDPNKDVDRKILNVFLENPKEIKVIFTSNSSGFLYISDNKEKGFQIHSTTTKDKTIFISIKNTSINLQFVLILGDSTKFQTSIIYGNIKLSANSLINILKLSDTFYDNTPIIKDVLSSFENLKTDFNIDRIKSYLNTDNIYYNNLELDNEIIKKIQSILNSTEKNKPEELIKNEDPNNFFKVWYEWYMWTKEQKKGGELEKTKKESEKVKKEFKNTLTKIKSQLLEMVKKEYKNTNKTTNTKIEAHGDTNIKRSKTDKDTSQSANIITAVIENYEKQREEINTISEKIKLDTKFIDMLDNLGLNLLDIFKVNFQDKLNFIFYTLILHIVVFSIVENLIKNEYVTNMVYVIAVYVGIYFALLFTTILILNNFMSYRIRTLLNYLNTEFNINLLTMHICIIFLFYIIVLILSNYIDLIKVEEDEDQLQLIFRIEIISSIIFIFSAIFIMLL